MKQPRILTLTEYETATFAAEVLPYPAGEKLFERYERQQRVVRVDFPGYKTAGRWQITPQGWVGTIPLTVDLHFALQPRVPLTNLFHMLAYAHDLHRWQLLPDLTRCDTLPGFYDCLAGDLAERVMDRARQGLFRAYLEQEERLPYVRGRLVPDWQQPADARPDFLCHFEEQTVDNAENQVLLWTLTVVDRSGLCRPATGRVVRRAMNLLRSVVTPHPMPSFAAQNRHYSRLNADYAPLHTLCALLLAHSVPDLFPDVHVAPAFLVHMATLFEQFVASWLVTHLPAPWRLERQARIPIDAAQEWHLAADMVLYDGAHRPAAVLDTKYKTAARVDPADFNQVVTYAQAKGCRRAFLVYPQPLARPVDIQLQELHIRSLTFPLAEDLEANGRHFLHDLLAAVTHQEAIAS